ncbi:MAG TPA: Hpt domain-containing protein, partial [Pirellulales bacterium]|nr:Hpt domain-containing protein [Pirellulales bacterium]
MSLPTMPAPLLRSSLADDPDLGEIVKLYVDEMPQRIEGLLARFAAADWDGLATGAHQLKGTAGSHGFQQIT